VSDPFLGVVFTGACSKVPPFVVEALQDFFARLERKITLCESLADFLSGHQNHIYVHPHVISKKDIQNLAATIQKRLVVVAFTYLGAPTQNGTDFLGADLLIDARNHEGAKRHMERFFSLLYDHPFVTPDPHESFMMHAHVARLRSGDVSRQVGACLVDEGGNFLSTGFNEVPKTGGGFYDNHTPAAQDFRDWMSGRNPSLDVKRQIFQEVLAYLQHQKNIPIPKDFFEEETLKEILQELKEHTSFMDILEYARNIHAEMSALIGALNTGRPLKGAHLYTTTFPCHKCTKHLVGAGIKGVSYLDPFSKSRALELFEDTITCTPHPIGDHRVVFEQFVGIPPKSYFLFEVSSREDLYGVKRTWRPRLR
jgi:deoxycytidylate deaminase